MSRTYQRKPWHERLMTHVRREGECLIWLGSFSCAQPMIATDYKENGNAIYKNVRHLLCSKMRLAPRSSYSVALTCGNERCVEWTHMEIRGNQPTERNLSIARSYWARVRAMRELDNTLANLGKEHNLSRERVRQIVMALRDEVAADLTPLRTARRIAQLTDKESA